MICHDDIHLYISHFVYKASQNYSPGYFCSIFNKIPAVMKEAEPHYTSNRISRHRKMATTHSEVLFIYESFRDANHLSPAINSAISVTSNPSKETKSSPPK
ncbi:hypothetical protein NPIL_267111 [Nephila pilipes]|uniref:Uncharacterized protein n=1 Tax=Nephila pilipes TaxID=299642 RepID=A0A8X6UCG4_NEPPI|nr:hypothetical protein NPIL_267111 [Nephila pilipes]